MIISPRKLSPFINASFHTRQFSEILQIVVTSKKMMLRITFMLTMIIATTAITTGKYQNKSFVSLMYFCGVFTIDHLGKLHSRTNTHKTRAPLK